MKIYLLNGHEAVIMDDGKGVVTVEPTANGVLSVDGEAVRVEGGETPCPTLKEVGATHATFTSTAGIRYRVVAAFVSGNGKLVSRVDPVRGYIEARMYIDRLEKRLEQYEAELRAFKGSIKHDSLGFLIKEEE